MIQHLNAKDIRIDTHKKPKIFKIYALNFELFLNKNLEHE